MVQPIIEIDIHINDQINNRNQLLGLKSHPLLGKGKEIVYIYSIVFDDGIIYPKGKGKVIYIGEACRDNEQTGARFKQHISSQQIKGGDTGTNFVISQYYYSNWKIKLRVFEIPKGYTRKEFESFLIISHMVCFGAPPIGQGKTTNLNTTNIYSYINANHDVYKELVQLFTDI